MSIGEWVQYTSALPDRGAHERNVCLIGIQLMMVLRYLQSVGHDELTGDTFDELILFQPVSDQRRPPPRLVLVTEAVSVKESGWENTDLNTRKRVNFSQLEWIICFFHQHSGATFGRLHRVNACEAGESVSSGTDGAQQLFALTIRGLSGHCAEDNL
jgi:hypothetical protein